MNAAFSGTYLGLRVLVTGHTGFKGSWLTLWLHSLGAHVAGLSLPPNTSPSHWSLVAPDGVEHHEADLRDATAVHRILSDFRPQMVFHLAAQPLVRRGYREPLETFGTNVMGLVNVLEAVRACGTVQALVNVTTDKVYRDSPGSAPGYAEDAPLGGHDPYSSSKACAELVTECYRGSYFGTGDSRPRVATARAGNVIGGGDWSEDRLVPDLVRAVCANVPLALRNPLAVRPWQHVLEPLSGYLLLGSALLKGDPLPGAWNFGPPSDATLPVIELVRRLQAHWPGLELVESPGPHPHETAILRLDCSRAAEILGWRPVWDAPTTIERTIAWYRAFHEHGEARSEQDLARYCDDARAAGMGWA